MTLIAKNKLITELEAACKKHPFEEKLLVSQDYISGRQLVEWAVRTGIPAVNLRIVTLPMIVSGMVNASTAPKLLPTLGVELAVGTVFDEACREKKIKYFINNAINRGLVEALAKSIVELRLNNYTSANLPLDIFVDTAKAADVKELMARYEKFLSDNNLTDVPGMLQKVTAESIEAAKKEGKIYLVRESLVLSDTETAFLSKLAMDRLIILKEDGVCGLKKPEGYLEKTECREGESKLAYLFEPDKIPKDSLSREVSLFAGIGARSEVREIFARLTKTGKYDEAEIIYTDREAYADLIFSFCERNKIPVTFSEGVSGYFTAAGRALINFLMWIKSDYEDIYLRRLFTSGGFKFDKDAELTGAGFSHLLRTSMVGWSRNRYSAILESRIKEAKALLESDSAEQEYEKNDESLKKRIKGLEELKKLCDELFSYVPDIKKESEVGYDAVCKDLLKFTGKRLNITGAFDSNFAGVFNSRLEVMLDTVKSKASFEEVIENLLRIVSQVNVSAEGPKPGAVHVSHYKNGGLSGRKNTYLAGLEESKFPEKIFQDPVVLDKEREKIKLTSESSGNRMKRSIYVMGTLLSGLRGELTASYPAYDIAEDRKSFPASLLLQLYRIKSGKPDADYEKLLSELGEPVGFYGRDSYPDLEEHSWWMGKIMGESGPRKGLDSIKTAYPWLAEGDKALTGRENDLFSEFDGMITADSSGLDPRKNGDVISCSRIEKAADCMFAYFLRYVLKVKPPDELEKNLDVWLDAALKGSLLHETLKNIMQKNLTEEGAALKELNIFIEKYRKEVPPPDESVYNFEKAQLENDIRLFLRINATIPGKPVKFEEQFNSEIELPAGGKVKIRGAIDRIDKEDGSKYCVWDYKSGSTFGHEAKDLKDGCKKVQYCVYAYAAEELLKKEDKNAVVDKSGYFFFSEKGMAKGGGGPVFVDKAVWPDWKGELERLFDSMGNGKFRVGKVPHCLYCDYKDICGVTDEEEKGGAVAAAKRKDEAFEVVDVKPESGDETKKASKPGKAVKK